jgi:hypothetical protein
MKNKVLMVLVSTILLLGMFSFVSANINDYIIYYPMNENSGTTVQNLGSFGVDGSSSGFYYSLGENHQNGIPSVQFVNGKVDGAYDFGEYMVYTPGDANHFNISLVDTNYDTPLIDASALAWVKPKAIGQGINGYDILFSQGNQNTGWQFGIVTNGELMYCMAGVGCWTTSGLNLQNDVYYRAGFTYNGTNLKLFLNGAEQPFSPTNPNSNQAYGNLTIGFVTHTLPQTPYYGTTNMTFDEVKIYNRPLSDAEVLQDYRVYVPSATPPNGNPLHYDNLITPTEPTPTITGAVTTAPKASFGLFQSVSNFFKGIGNWFSKFFGFL